MESEFEQVLHLCEVGHAEVLGLTFLDFHLSVVPPSVTGLSLFFEQDGYESRIIAEAALFGANLATLALLVSLRCL